MLTISNHGGLCCGMKVIWGFGYDSDALDTMEPALPAKTANHSDIQGASVMPDFNMFYQGAPKETRVKRFQRYVDFIKVWRPSHLIEVTLSAGPYGSQKAWFPVLEKAGFNEVSDFYNSNSGNRVKVFHLVIGDK